MPAPSTSHVVLPMGLTDRRAAPPTTSSSPHDTPSIEARHSSIPVPPISRAHQSPNDLWPRKSGHVGRTSRLDSIATRLHLRRRMWWRQILYLLVLAFVFRWAHHHITQIQIVLHRSYPVTRPPTAQPVSAGTGTLKPSVAGKGHETQHDDSPFKKGRKDHEWWTPSPIFDDGGNPWPTQGSDGSLVKTETGRKFVYRNDFGGRWDARVNSLAARCQADTPPLSRRWNYARQTISGVNLGGWLVLEPFITPAIFEPYLQHKPPPKDEYALSAHLGDQLDPVLTRHYETFITEKDFAEIAGAGLNWVRVPISYWAIETREGEPFLPRVSWKYFLKAIEWARKYGLRINLDLHAVPGSANGWNHGGKSGTVGLLNGVMGIANAERTINIVRAFAKFISLPINRDIVCMFSVLNEPFVETIGSSALRALYLKMYEAVRTESGYGDGNGPVVVIHDGFIGTTKWFDFLPGADRIALDSHRYIAFRSSNNQTMEQQALKPCDLWMNLHNRTMRTFGIGMVAEWSVAINDCGRFINGVNSGSRYEGTLEGPGPEQSVAHRGGCGHWERSDLWDAKTKQGMQDVALSHMDAFQNWFFWTWKTGPSLRNPTRVVNPMWSYSMGLQQGYIPPNPRKSQGHCRRLIADAGRPQPKVVPYSGKLTSWQTGAGPDSGANMDRGNISWPPETIGLGEPFGNIYKTSELPRYAETAAEGPLKIPGVPRSMAGPRWYEPIEGCEYLDAWEGVGPNVRIPKNCQL
ncbi:BQ2448_3660 [Microbotryum intermedium]|uniref:glucan 1,3-beta-glucosidase n=1 Tax=Microbotryum intermedium TaxID=269621 RepID=A0A238FI86_9BASI|nr:BQ2448_3660 [Microbotryum intermedium]